MEAYTHLFYGLGQVVYAIAMADGKVQRAEQDKLRQIVLKHLEKKKIEFDYTEVIFQILKQDQVFDAEKSYENGLESIKLGDHLLTDELKATFLDIVKEIAASYPPTTGEEHSFIVRFKKDLAEMG